MNLRALLAVSVVVCLPAEAAPKAPPNPNFAKAATKEEYLAIAQKAFDDAFTSKKDRDKVLAAYQAAKKESDKAARSTANGGALMVALGKGAGVALLALAAQDLPDDALVATSFGVALSRAGRKIPALQVHLYANALAPRTPQVVTNLGSLYADLGATGLAFKWLLEVTNHSPEYCPAWNALAILYGNEGDFKRGVAAYLHSLPCSGLKKKKQKMRDERTKEISEPPKEPPGAGQGGEGEGASGAGEGGAGKGGPSFGGEIFFEPYPTWSTVDAFIAANEGIERWKKRLASLRDGAQGELDPQGPLRAYKRRMALEAAHPLAVAVNAPQDLDWALDDLHRSTTRVLDQLRKAHEAEVKAIDKKMQEPLTRSLERFTKVNMAPLGGMSTVPIEQTRQLHNSHCDLAKSTVGTSFVTWRDSEKRYYGQVTDVLRDYWKQSAVWISRYPDADDRQFHQALVESTIWGSLTVFPMVCPTRALVYTMARTSPVGGCGKEKVPPPPPSSSEEDERPGKVESSCPFSKDQAVKASAGWRTGPEAEKASCGLSMKGCEEVEASCELELLGPIGVEGSVGYDMEKKEVTVSVGGFIEAKPETGNEVLDTVQVSAKFVSKIDVTLSSGGLERVTWTIGPTLSKGLQAAGIGVSTTDSSKLEVLVLVGGPDEK